MGSKYRNELERDAEEVLTSGIKAMKGLCFKLKFLGVMGAPDRLVLMPKARIYFVELKKTTGKLEPSQELMFPKLERLGFKVHTLYGVFDVLKFINLMELEND